MSDSSQDFQKDRHLGELHQHLEKPSVLSWREHGKPRNSSERLCNGDLLLGNSCVKHVSQWTPGGNNPIATMTVNLGEVESNLDQFATCIQRHGPDFLNRGVLWIHSTEHPGQASPCPVRGIWEDADTMEYSFQQETDNISSS